MAVVGSEGFFVDSVKRETTEEDPVAVLENYFKFRYTEHDDEYLKCRNRRKMMYQVPVISPWPPPLARNRRPRGRFRDRHYEKERYGSDRSHHRSLVSSHERYNEWSPPRYHGSYRYRSHSPGSPQHSPPSSHIPHSYDHDQFKSSQEDELLSSQEQHQREKEEQSLAGRPHQREEEKDIESKPAPALPNFMDSVIMNMNMRESPEKLTDSDVQALLINAGSARSKLVLPRKRQKKEKKEPSIKKQQPDEKATITESSTAKRKEKPDGLLVSHGKRKSVTALILRDGLSTNKMMALPHRHKRKKMRRVLNNISDEEDDEIIDPVKVSNDTMQLSTLLRQEATDGGTAAKVNKVEEAQPVLKSAFYNQPESFTVHINLKHVNLTSKMESFNHSEIRPVSPPVSPSTAPCMYSSAVTLDDSNKHVVLRLSKPVEPETEVTMKKSHKSKKKKKTKES